ncbi:MAG: hypothetical protein R2702_14795 [Acidimicrobiales bacterium]
MITADYRIELEGELGHDLHPAFAPALVEAGDGRTLLLATAIDQAGLHDLLDRARPRPGPARRRGGRRRCRPRRGPGRAGR